MNRDQLDREVQEFALKFCEDFDISDSLPRIIALEKRITNFALIVMEKQKEEDLQMVITALKEIGGRFEWEGWQDDAIKIIETAFHKKDTDTIASLVGTAPIICEGCGGEINPDYSKCIRCG